MNKMTVHLFVAFLFAAAMSAPLLAQTPKLEILGKIPAEGGSNFAGLASDGKRLLLTINNVATNGSGAILVDVQTGKHLRSFSDAEWQLQNANLSPTGKLVLITGQKMIPEAAVELNVLDSDTGKVKYQYVQKFGSPHGAISAGDKFLIHNAETQAPFEDAREHLRCIRMSDNKQLWDLLLSKPGSGSPQFTWSPVAKQIFVTRYTPQKSAVLSVTDGSVAFTVSNDDKDELAAAAFSADGKVLEVVYQGGLCVSYGTADGKISSSQRTLAKPELYLPVTPDLKWLLSGDQGVITWTPLFADGKPISLRTGPRPTSVPQPSADGRFAIIQADGRDRGDLTIVRLPDPNTIAQPPHSSDAQTPPDAEAQSPQRLVPAGEKIDWNNPRWWCEMALAQTSSLTSNTDRRQILWRSAAVAARADDLPTALRLLSSAGALPQPAVAQPDWQMNEKFAAYYWIARLTARSKGLAEAHSLLDQLSESERSAADWMPPAALAAGRAEANDVDSVRKLIEPLRGQQRSEVASRAIRVLVAAGHTDAAASLVELMPDGMEKTVELARVAMAKVNSGDYAYAMASFDKFVIYSPQDIELEGPFGALVAAHAIKDGHPEMIAELRAQKSLFPSDIDRGAVQGYLAAGTPRKAIDVINGLDAHSQQNLRELVVACYAKTGEVESIFDLYRNDTNIYWASGAIRFLAQAGKLDAATKALSDPRLATMDKQSRSQATLAVVTALLKANRVDDADKFIPDIVENGPADVGQIQSMRAGALARLGRHNESKNDLSAAINKVIAQADIPPELQDLMIMDLATKAGEYQLIIDKLAASPIRPHQVRRKNFIVGATISAMAAGNDAALAKLLPLFVNVDTDALSSFATYAAIAHAMLVEQSEGGKYIQFVNQLPTALGHCRACLAAAELFLPADIAEEQYPKWDR